MELGVNDVLFADQVIGPVGWNGKKHAPEGLNVVPRKGLGILADYNSILKQISISEKQETPWAKNIPKNHRQIDEWLLKHLGFVPTYVSCLRNVEQKRAVCLLMWLFLIRNKDESDSCVDHEPCEWSSGAKALMFYVYTSLTGNLLLRGHAAFLATRQNVQVSILYAAANGYLVKNDRLDTALEFIRNAASLKRKFPASLNARLLRTAISPKGVIELVSTLGLFNMLHRLSAMVAPEPVVFEKTVRDVIAPFASVLSIDPDDASPQDTSLCITLLLIIKLVAE
ncbi:hypothetical protein HK096_002852 [Nowakowskiella sp. JEL0078]|nr:hypothetical protein HK096_002852 [Nowakowskiella sp. JEL0078]